MNTLCIPFNTWRTDTIICRPGTTFCGAGKIFCCLGMSTAQGILEVIVGKGGSGSWGNAQTQRNTHRHTDLDIRSYGTSSFGSRSASPSWCGFTCSGHLFVFASPCFVARLWCFFCVLVCCSRFGFRRTSFEQRHRKNRLSSESASHEIYQDSSGMANLLA